MLTNASSGDLFELKFVFVLVKFIFPMICFFLLCLFLLSLFTTVFLFLITLFKYMCLCGYFPLYVLVCLRFFFLLCCVIFRKAIIFSFSFFVGLIIFRSQTEVLFVIPVFLLLCSRCFYSLIFVTFFSSFDELNK